MTPDKSVPPPSGCICGDTGCKIPHGLCHCGCGETTNIHTKNDYARGRIKGQPAKFCRRHQYRSSGNYADYIPETGQKRWPKGFNSCYLCGARKGRQNEMCEECRNAQRRPIEQPDDPSYRFIPLTQGQHSIVETELYEQLNQSIWFARWCEAGKCFYAIRNGVNAEGKKCGIFMHREVMGLTVEDPRTVDHAFKNTLDNRRFIDGKENLRFATMREQAYNKGKRRDNSTGYKGVRLHKRSGLYMASITYDGVFHYLGYRKTAEAAWRELYVPAALEHHGKFARVA